MAIPAHAWFVVSEIMILPNWPAAMPKEGLYFNIVLWTTFIILSYLGWNESGAALPDTDALIPSGRFGTPLLVWAINNTISYGLPLVPLRDKIMEQYAVRDYQTSPPHHLTSPPHHQTSSPHRPTNRPHHPTMTLCHHWAISPPQSSDG